MFSVRAGASEEGSDQMTNNFKTYLKVLRSDHSQTRLISPNRQTNSKRSEANPGPNQKEREIERKVQKTERKKHS